MLTQEEVKRYAHMRRLKIVDHIWKDYLQDLLLYMLYRKMPKMVFGGGTCIWKMLKGDRFSEDIDAFSATIPEDLAEYLKKELSYLGIECEIIKKRMTSNMLFLKIALSFPSHPRKIEVSIEVLAAQPKNTTMATLYSPYPDMPPVEINMLPKEEMLANKVSAIYGRNMSRDVHDIYFLLKSGAKINMASVKIKMPKFSIAGFEKKLAGKKAFWESLGPLLIGKLPDFEYEKEYILSAFRKATEK